MKKIFSFLFGITAAVLLTACRSTPAEADPAITDEKIQVTATNSILADMAANVGGDLIEIYSIVPVGTDPHEYEPLPLDIQKAADADIIFYNGLNLETGNGWFLKLMETADKTADKDYFALSKGVTPLYLDTSEQEEDPHAWLDITNGIQYIRNILEILSEKDPANAEIYERNAEDCIESLTRLDAKAKEKFSGIPEEKRILVTSEGAFKYFAKAYDLSASYIWEINTESQGTPEQMKTIIDTVRASQISALFLETSVDPRSMEQVSEETGVPVYSKLFTDSLGNSGEDGDSYYGMMEWNIEQIGEGLCF